MSLGRKIERQYENPFDNIFIDIAEWFNLNFFKSLHMTPNMITTLSLLVGLSSSFAFYRKKYFLAAFLFLTAYILDCSDGHFARYFNMVTTFGDYYDHICDLLKLLSMVFVVAVHPIISFNTKVIFFVLFVLLNIGTGMHLGCQEKLYNPMSQDSLSFTKTLCPNKNNIIWTRYVGAGTTMMFVTIFFIYIGFTSR